MKTGPIDLNCDLGEGYPNDEALMPLVSSANIACGFHAGDTGTMRRTVDWALMHNAAIGVHPGFDDKRNFGREELRLPQQAYYDLVWSQMESLETIARAAGAVLHHVKPHGALYNMAARDAELAHTIAHAVLDFNPQLILYGLSGSQLIEQARFLGLATACEVFADRTYQPDGSLTPRSRPDALIRDPDRCLRQLLQMVLRQTVTATDGKTIPIRTETICLHGDGAHALEFARLVRTVLAEKGIPVQAP